MQYKNHFGEFLQNGYRASAEAVQVKFPYRTGTREIGDFKVGLVDGFTKTLIMSGVISFIRELDFTKEQLQHRDMQRLLTSFAAIRCSYSHYDNPSHHFLHSLRCSAEILFVLPAAY